MPFFNTLTMLHLYTWLSAGAELNPLLKYSREFEGNHFWRYTPNANMADHSVGARDEFHASEASEASVFCFDSASPEKSCFVVDLVCFISPWLQVLCFWMPPEGSEITEEKLFFFSFSFPVHLLRGKQTEERSSRSPSELKKFVCYISGRKI